MASTLNRTGEQKPVVDKGHGTEALGPGDTSDTGSDVTGGPGLNEEIRRGMGLGLDRGTTSDPDVSNEPAPDAGADVGDANLDSDSTASGSGERATAGRDTPVQENRDRDTDRIERITEIGGPAGPPEQGSGSTADLADESAEEGAAEGAPLPAGGTPATRERSADAETSPPKRDPRRQP